MSFPQNSFLMPPSSPTEPPQPHCHQPHLSSPAHGHLSLSPSTRCCAHIFLPGPGAPCPAITAHCSWSSPRFVQCPSLILSQWRCYSCSTKQKKHSNITKNWLSVLSLCISILWGLSRWGWTRSWAAWPSCGVPAHHRRALQVPSHAKDSMILWFSLLLSARNSMRCQSCKYYHKNIISHFLFRATFYLPPFTLSDRPTRQKGADRCTLYRPESVETQHEVSCCNRDVQNPSHPVSPLQLQYDLQCCRTQHLVHSGLIPILDLQRVVSFCLPFQELNLEQVTAM